MKRMNAERLQDRALKDGYTYAQLRQWGTGWSLLLLRTGALVGGTMVHSIEEYEEQLALDSEKA